MKKTTSRKTIRFRRWARKGYAIFSSLGCCITIGRLDGNIADASLKKQKAGISIKKETTDENVASDNEEPDDGLSYDILLRLELIGQYTSLVDAAYCIKNNHIEIPLNSISRKDIQISFRLFYFI